MCGNPTKGAARRIEEKLRKCSMTKNIGTLWRGST